MSSSDSNVSDHKKDPDHSHCERCVLSTCLLQVGCPVIHCSRCQWSLHSCKLDDHVAHICMEQLVPCTNQAYGCDLLIRRRDKGAHLRHCPASVVQCRHAYARPIEVQKPKTRVRPYPVSLHEQRLRNDILFLESNNFIEEEEDSEGVISIDYFSVYILMYCDLKKLSASFEKGRRAYQHTYMHMAIDFNHTVTSNHAFVCGLFIQRDQFSNHMKTHDELCPELFFKIQQCPFYQYSGCNFTSNMFRSQPLWYPLGLRSNLDTNTFVLSDSTSKEYMSGLPVEALLCVLSFLDCDDLWSVSQTCVRLRSICEGLLPKKGIVYKCWRNVNGHWSYSSDSVWTFPRTSSQEALWQPDGYLDKMLCHLENDCHGKSLPITTYSEEDVIDLAKDNVWRMIKKSDMNRNRYK